MTDEKTDTAEEKADIAVDDVLAKANQTLLRRGAYGIRPGWLHPRTAYAWYWQNGQVRQMVNRFCVMMVKAGWTYKDGNAKGFVWSPTQSKLESIGLKKAMVDAARWAFIFGGAAIQHLEENGDRPTSEPYAPSRVHEYVGLKVWDAYNLQPEPGKNYKTAEWFYPRYNPSEDAKIHRSRLSIVVVEDVPVQSDLDTSGMISTITRWPPSWLEGIYESFCSAKSAHQDVNKMMRTKSLVHLSLFGWRKVQTSPDSDEAQEALVALEETLERLANDGVLVTDIEDLLQEVGRDLANVDKILERKELWWASSGGVPKELAIMEAEGNLGVNSAPIDAYNDMVDGWRQTMYTPVIEDATDRALAAQKYQANVAGDPIEVPTQYTIEHGPIQEESGKERAERQDEEASARERDFKSGLPFDVWVTDPALQEKYEGMSAWLEDRNAAKSAAKAKAAEQNQAHPEGEDMISASEVGRKLKCSSSTVIKMATSGGIPGKKIAGRWKFYLSQVLAALEPGEVAAAEADSRSDGIAQDSGLGLSESTTFGNVYGASAAMREVFAVLEVMREHDISVLLLGETGVGKEGIAQGLHGGDGPLMAINCAAMPTDPDDVVVTMREALDKASGGVLFLDEVGDLPRVAQSALLAELSEGYDCRLISATSLNVRDPYMFRPDLYFRLAGVEVEIPPLRDREADVHWIAEKFYREFMEGAGLEQARPPFTEGALGAMLRYPWPGNIRELKSAVQRGAAFAGRATPIGVEHLQLRGAY